jgi:O-antigen/teichoic acid export membrane protein
MISVQDMGILTILSTALTGLQVISNLGLGNVITKLVAENMAQGKVKVASAACYVSLLLNITTSTIVALAIWLTAFPAGISGLPRSNTIGAISFLLVVDVMVGYANIFGAGIVGLQRYRALSTMQAIYTISRQVLIVYLVFISNSLVGWIWAWIITDVFFTVATAAYFISELGLPTFDISPKRLLTLSLPLLFSNIVLFAYNYVDRLFLIGRVNLDALGVYGAATQAFGAFTAFIGVLPIVLLPAFAEVHGLGGLDNLRSALKTASRYVSLTALPLAFCLLAAARAAITLFVGRRYDAGAFPLAELAAFSTAAILAYPLGPAFIVLNETALYALTIILPLAIGIGVALLTISTLGVVAASTARGIAMVLNLILSIVLLRRKLPVTFDKTAIIKSLTCSIIMAAVIWLIQSVVYNPLLLPLYLLCGLFVYLFSLRVLKAVTAEDLDFLRNVAGPRFRTIIWLLSRILLT